MLVAIQMIGLSPELASPFNLGAKLARHLVEWKSPRQPRRHHIGPSRPEAAVGRDAADLVHGGSGRKPGREAEMDAQRQTLGSRGCNRLGGICPRR